MHIAPVSAPTTSPISPRDAVSHAPQPVAAGRFWPSWLKTILTRQAERRQLLALEDRDLRDIGLTPAEAWALARKPVWRG